MSRARQPSLLISITNRTQKPAQNLKLGIKLREIGCHLKHPQMQIGDRAEGSTGHEDEGDAISPRLLPLVPVRGELVVRQRLAGDRVVHVCVRRLRPRLAGGGWRGHDVGIWGSSRDPQRSICTVKSSCDGVVDGVPVMAWLPGTVLCRRRRLPHSLRRISAIARDPAVRSDACADTETVSRSVVGEALDLGV
jgi:hypothetical protein